MLSGGDQDTPEGGHAASKVEFQPLNIERSYSQQMVLTENKAHANAR